MLLPQLVSSAHRLYHGRSKATETFDLPSVLNEIDDDSLWKGVVEYLYATVLLLQVRQVDHAKKEKEEKKLIDTVRSDHTFHPVLLRFDLALLLHALVISFDRTYTHTHTNLHFSKG